jgi:predicted transcriptional regulator
MAISKELRDLINEEAKAAEAGEADQTIRPLPPHVKVSQPNRARSKVLQVRLNPDELDALERIADRRELPVSTIAREQLLRYITMENAGPNPLRDLIAAATHAPRSAKPKPTHGFRADTRHQVLLHTPYGSINGPPTQP